ncbi:hypothetical protein [Microbacterium oleivorans]|uniref:PepSY domain-containing protein n=1 Tax=Microbacterium oleivorans TaxID=273677 RepID=A0A7D5JYS8_9MICO|nr:hypothetical protein [Microbacterium oleivorans]QLD12023.1 hypothetical protein HW566_09760 [Microbacterium oleivorans]
MSDHDRNLDDQPTPAADPTASVPPASPTAAAPAASPSNAEVPAGPTAATPPRRARRTALLAGGAVVAAALLVGGGAAIGAAVADDDDEDGREASLVSDDTRSNAVGTDGDRGGAPGERTNAGGTSTEPYGAASVDELERVADAARGAADGSVVSIDADRDGTWDVQLVAADGSESEVRVSADGTATVRETEAAEAGDVAAGNVLDAATLGSMVEAALAEADGRVIEIDADDDDRSPFDVAVLTADRGIVEITLDVDGSVLRTETDD